MLEAIPKVKLNDKATWIETNIIAVSAAELFKYKKRLQYDYFQQKEVILLSIIPEDFDFNYSHVFNTLPKESIQDLILTSFDCACYRDKPEWCNEELDYLIEDNNDLFKDHKIEIGILKGYDAETYEKIRKSLETQVNNYLVYISGESRSNPKYFSLVRFFENHFPNGLDKPIYLHGCPLKQLKNIPKLNIEVKGIITAGHIADAIYRGHRHYKRETRISKNWVKWSTAIESVQ